MLSDAHFKVVGVACVITAVGTAKNINPKHFLSFFVNPYQLPGACYLSPFILRQAQDERKKIASLYGFD